ncbi:hypothetical protein ST47_g7348 [Ascochyta rabiei]|uniref:Uncharacterized protein n=2 Tax=Didymella rabiei TaxID=5454 RepID=A0A163AYK8_DIDRA|nr:hypothetical protein ST47_g7348 [Ascochyta rabiei]
MSAVRGVLNKAQSEHALLFISLVDNHKNHPHACKLAQRLIFGPNERDFPGLGKKLSPFDVSGLPSPDDMQRLLIDDLRAARKEHNDHVTHTVDNNATVGSETDDKDICSKLLETLADHDNKASGGLLSFPSRSLDETCGDATGECDDSLRESITTATILQRDTLLSIQHSNEGTTFTTLLSGAIAWIIWPPTDHNTIMLKSSYEAFDNGFDGTKTNVAAELEGGVCLVQSVGEAIRIPPFCPILCLSLELSILATYSIVNIDQVVSMLRKLPLLQVWFKSEIDGERKQADLVTALLEQLSSILEGSFEPANLKKHKYPYLQEGPLRSLLQAWDDVKNNVAHMLDPVSTERLMKMWEQFLRSARGRECWICGKTICNKPRDMRKHFKTEHWPAADIAEVK